MSKNKNKKMIFLDNKMIGKLWLFCFRNKISISKFEMKHLKLIWKSEKHYKLSLWI